MEKTPIQVLVVDRDAAQRRRMKRIVERCGFEFSGVGTVRAASKALDDPSFDAVLLDPDLPDESGTALLPRLEAAPNCEVIVLTSTPTMDSAISAFRRGALDYLKKPVDQEDLVRHLNRIRKSRRLHREVDQLRSELRRFGRFGRLIGESPAMQDVYDVMSRVAPADGSVLIVGETGTGKELVAETIHSLSRRSDGPYVPVNSGAIQPTLIESELFGHEKGAFTGADQRRIGYFEQADGGTLFLDEVTEMPADLQVKLLRVLETGKFRRVGGSRLISSDVRVVAATNREPREAIEEGALREDLHYRLEMFPIRVPPLRERGEDVLMLAQAFLQKLNDEHGTRKSLTRDFRDEIRTARWPGNVRELKNVIHRAWVLADDDVAPPSAAARIGPLEDDAGPAADGLRIQVGQSIAEAERRLIEATLEAYDGDKKRAAETLGISLKTLYSRLKVYEAASA